MLVGALAGAQDPLQPLAPFSQNASNAERGQNPVSPGSYAGFTRFSAPSELTRLAAAAKAEGRPVMLDFYADWCISCKIMERDVFSEPGIQARLAPFELLQLDMTDNSPAQRALLDRLGLFGPPAILFLDPSGKEMKSLRVLGEMDLKQFSRHLGKLENALDS